MSADIQVGSISGRYEVVSTIERAELRLFRILTAAQERE